MTSYDTLKAKYNQNISRYRSYERKLNIAWRDVVTTLCTYIGCKPEHIQPGLPITKYAKFDGASWNVDFRLVLDLESKPVFQYNLMLAFFEDQLIAKIGDGRVYRVGEEEWEFASELVKRADDAMGDRMIDPDRVHNETYLIGYE